jgi:hypothetical protein
MKLILSALLVTAGLQAQTIIASVGSDSFDAGYLDVTGSNIQGLSITQHENSVSITNQSNQAVLSYTLRQRSGIEINDSVMVNLGSFVPVIGPGETVEVQASGTVELDSAVFADGTEAGKDEAQTLNIVRRARQRLGNQAHRQPLFDRGPVPVPDPPFGYVIYYSCQPATCEQDATAIGTFSVGVNVTGQLANFNTSRRKNIRINPFVEALNCTTPTRLLAFGAIVDDPTYGYGLAGTVEAFQFGVQVLTLQNIIWYSRSLNIGNPTSPCT